MSGNTFGKIFKITTFGESHGKGLGVIIDGMPPNIKIDSAIIQQKLDTRKCDEDNICTSERKESDTAEILSGVFEGYSTGTPISIFIKNTAQKSKDYSKIAETFRPGHADFTYWEKYGFRDYRGGGRASGRETCVRVAAGAVAELALKELYGDNFCIKAYTIEVAGINAQETDYSEIEQNALKCADKAAATKMEEKITALKEAGDSTGAIIKCEVFGIPAGLGEPVFDKLDAELAKAIISIGAVKGIEFGKGFESASMLGSQWNDSMHSTEDGLIHYDSNNAGGILGGISNGNVISFNVAVKPVPSIYKEQKTINIAGDNVDLLIEGRHDVCLAPRIIPVIEAMTAITLLDMALQQRAIFME